jgi:hypothetical protein
MDSIMHYTDGTLTLVATASFVICFMIGAWIGAKFGRVTIIPALIISAAMFYVRSKFGPLSFEAIGSVSVLHVAAGALTALLVKRSINRQTQPDQQNRQ